jgi:nitroreductase
METLYDPKITPWLVSEQHFPGDKPIQDQVKFLLRYAILAPSSHNTQPWKFKVQNNTLSVYADLTRWLKVADSDQRELRISIGCSLENLCVAAQHFGLKGEVNYFPDNNNSELVSFITFNPSGSKESYNHVNLFSAITKRTTNHNPFEDRTLEPEHQNELFQTCNDSSLTLELISDSERKMKIEDLIVQADAMQFSNPAWREELAYWLGKGVFGTSWIISKVAKLAVTYLDLSKGTMKKDASLFMSAPVFAVISSQTNDAETHIRVGRLFERISLAATLLGLHVHPMSQVLEFSELKAALSQMLEDEDKIPQHTFRLGYSEPEREHTPRRPIEEVLI